MPLQMAGTLTRPPSKGSQFDPDNVAIVQLISRSTVRTVVAILAGLLAFVLDDAIAMLGSWTLLAANQITAEIA